MDTNGYFYSPTYGRITPDQMRAQVRAFMHQFPDSTYRMIIGSDSQPHNSHAIGFVSAFIIHRVGAGGIYFWRRTVQDRVLVLKQRIFTEATLSLTVAGEITQLFTDEFLPKDLEIHVDVGRTGPTRELIAEVTGMIRGSGFVVRIKPESYGASTIADRHT